MPVSLSVTLSLVFVDIMRELSGDREPVEATRARSAKREHLGCEQVFDRNLVAAVTYGLHCGRYSVSMTESTISPLTQFILMGVFFGVIAAIPIAWYLLGLKTYGTGDYHQP